MLGESICLTDYDLFSDAVPVENGVAPLVAKLRAMGCHVIASCEGHGAHQPGVLFTSEPYILFVPSNETARMACLIENHPFWRNLTWEWGISVCEHIEHNIAYRLCPKKFDRGIDRWIKNGFFQSTISLVSYRHALKSCWPEIRESLNKDIAIICRMLPTHG